MKRNNPDAQQSGPKCLHPTYFTGDVGEREREREEGGGGGMQFLIYDGN